MPAVRVDYSESALEMPQIESGVRERILLKRALPKMEEHKGQSWIR
jgi:hypothetical protein